MSPDDKGKEELVAYFMGQTNERLTQIEVKLVELLTFRAEVMASARSTAIVVGAVWAVLTVVIGAVLRKYGY